MSTKFNHVDYKTISTPTFGTDFAIFSAIVNAGIDSHLEGFTQSKFFFDCGKFYFHFHRSEENVLVRRLEEMLADNNFSFSEEIENWIENIKNYDLLTAE